MCFGMFEMLRFVWLFFKSRGKNDGAEVKRALVREMLCGWDGVVCIGIGGKARVRQADLVVAEGEGRTCCGAGKMLRG
jgi:hypothetical protein